MDYWRYHNPVSVIFGCGSRKYLIDKFRNLKILVVTTSRGRSFIENDSVLCPILKNVKWIDSIKSNPSLNEIQKEIYKISSNNIEAIIAFGGGSCIDSAKVISAALSSELDPKELFQIIKNPNKYLIKSPIPICAIPTTSGTGSEVTPFATIWDVINKKKLSLQHNFLYPKYAIVDPELTYDLPYEITSSSGLDSLNQALESIWNLNKTPFSIFVASKSIKKSLKALNLLHKDLKNIAARKLISEASLLAGIAISQTRTAICHSISYPITANYGVSHGLACAYTMYAVSKKVNEYNSNCFLDVLKEMNLESGDLLIEEIKNIVEIYKVKEKVNKSLSNKDEAFSLIDLMITPGRSDNFILPVDKKLIKSILEDSF